MKNTLSSINYKSPAVISLIATNLVILLIALFQSWSPLMIVLAFWFENLVIGFYTLLKMVYVKHLDLPKENDAQPKKLDQKEGCIMGFLKGFVMIFFIVHFYGFCLVHGVFIIATLQEGQFNGSILPSENLSPSEMREIFFAGLGLLISHGISFKVNYINKKEFQKTALSKLLFSPYKRIVLVHVFVIAAAFLLVLTDLRNFLLISLFFVGKTILDLVQHHKSHKTIQNSPQLDV